MKLVFATAMVPLKLPCKINPRRQIGKVTCLRNRSIVGSNPTGGTIDTLDIIVYNLLLQGEIMSTRIESRSGEIDTERCVANAGGRYDLVVAAAQRLREMKRRARETNTHVTAIDALKEVQSGTFNMTDYLVKVK